MKKFIRILLVIALAAVTVFSTYGWHSSKKFLTSYTKTQEALAKDLKSHVQVLSQDIGWRGLEQYDNLQKSADYIVSSFEKAGLTVERQEFLINDKRLYNIVASKKGTRDSNEVIVVGAHYDSYFNPGADNNASGMAVLLESAKALSQKEMKASFQFVAFTNSQPPFFGTKNMGSAIYLEKMKAAGVPIKGAVILDSVGVYAADLYSQRYPLFMGLFYPDTANFIVFVANFKSWEFLNAVGSIFRQKSTLPAESVLGFDFIHSDHWAFWKKGIPAVLVTDTGPYRNPNAESLSDTFKTLNYFNMAKLTEGFVAVCDKLSE